ncbi:hypothetical protein, partial [Thalassotalea sp. ND16A]|uniref:hypothetical protein n=1 Tax=Thalassotalea sp. ND16A TaxID=1535422 RepID=UPI001F3432A3
MNKRSPIFLKYREFFTFFRKNIKKEHADHNFVVFLVLETGNEKRRAIVSKHVLNLGGPVQQHNGMPVISFCQISKLEKLCLDHIFCDSPLSGTLSSISFSQECK